ncbi:metallophosphoesterase family protein [Vibrio methylphosphonaticus]|uniref:metallophosphoesterase family protein n=1 Tax=Vibrio methylphosphonaticus TaxID=2946866 RepID=UPI002029E6A5|nr:metallophosphoesterase family protein [Vibrio methylphosphonaticus]MCL9775788.1 metallophosphatase family protein [Vibrio methylphosphonaticus]
MKKFAVISDIHSNVYALKAVVADARAKGVNDFINLGDILYGPIAPRETYEYLRTLNALTICGNQDRQIYQATHSDVQSNPTMPFILQDLGAEPLTWMRQLPFDSRVLPDSRPLSLPADIYACHGTPSDDLTYLLEDASSGRAVVREDAEIIDLLAGITAPIVLCGHTHLPRCVQVSTGQCIVNPGSVGLPAYEDDEPFPHAMETYSPMASYAVISQTTEGSWDVSFNKVAYDVSKAVEAARAQGRLDWVHFLTTGRRQ